MAVGLPLKTTYADGDVYSASDVNDTNGTINITAAPYAAGKNKIINGDFGVWQRGTSFSNPANGTYCADRFKTIHDGTGATRTVSQQSFTLGAAPVSGYESQYFMRYAVTAAGTGNTYQGMQQFIEDVRTFAGQTVTMSFWAKADASRTISVDATQYFGSGGSGNVQTLFTSQNLTTSWARYSATITVPSISGKTIGTGSALIFGYYAPANTACTIDIWGVQLEAGSTATAFQTATGTIQGELAACQRYYYKTYNQADAPATATTTGSVVIGFPNTSTQRFGISYPTMRGNPTITTYNTSTGATSSLRTDTGTNLALGGPFFIGETRAFVDVTSTSGNYGTFHFVASAEL